MYSVTPARAVRERPGSRMRCGTGMPSCSQARSTSVKSVAVNSAIGTSGSSGVAATPRPPPRSSVRIVQPSSSCARAAKAAIQSTAARAAATSRSCEPMCMWRPSVSGSRRRASSESSGVSPNFEPWWPVRIASCVSASIPGVTRMSVRETRASRARSISSSESTTTSAPASAAASSSSRDLLFPWTTRSRPAIPAAWANRSSPSVETSAPMPSSARIRISATFGNAFVP